eukprot:scaffold260784_cov26-Tisochrysis_lutea.AAC.2
MLNHGWRGQIMPTGKQFSHHFQHMRCVYNGCLHACTCVPAHVRAQFSSKSGNRGAEQAQVRVTVLGSCESAHREIKSSNLVSCLLSSAAPRPSIGRVFAR